jgi:peptidoglycan/xylan/chitin deacetylase (PgdA/CDA1 family)
MLNPITHAASWAPRAVARIFPDVIVSVDPEVPETARQLFLTFDDGPTPQMTSRILELLELHGAQATFFLLGTTAKTHVTLVRRMVALGHIVGNHSFSHVDPWRCRPSVLEDELDTTTKLLEDITGRAVPLVRPPYGHVTPRLVDWARENGRLLVLWDVMPGDYLWSSTAPQVAGFVKKHARPGSIVVLHDNTDVNVERTTYRALATTLNYFGQRRWQFSGLDDRKLVKQIYRTVSRMS